MGKMGGSNRRGGMIVWALVMVFLALGGGRAAAAKPNILFIFLDDLGYGDLSVMGSKDVRSPNIDRLAKGGARLLNGYSMAAFCSPARAGAMTGQNPAEFGHFSNPAHVMEDTRMGLPPKLTILPQTLKTENYDTYIIGKWHLGFSFKHHPLNRGFDEFFGFLGGRFSYWKPIYWVKQYNWFEYIYDNFQRVKSVEYLTTEFTNKAIEYMKKSKRSDKPFFLYLALNAPHAPFHYPEEDVQPWVSKDRIPHVAMLKNLDDNIGRIYAFLKSHGMLKDTLIVLGNDNGGHRKGAINLPLRDYKGGWYEGGIRIPFFVYWKGVIKPGQKIQHPITLMDLYPTFQAVAQVKPENRNKDLLGKNFMPYIQMVGENRPRRTGPIHDEIILGSFKSGIVRKGRYKLVAFNQREYSFFDIKRDISEENDLKDIEPYKTLARNYLAKFKVWMNNQAPEAFPRKQEPIPVKVEIRGPTLARLKTNKKYRFIVKASHTQQKPLTLSYEYFKTENTVLANFRRVKSNKTKRRYNAARTRVDVKFLEEGKWTVRVNAFDGTFIKWFDFKVKVCN